MKLQGIRAVVPVILLTALVLLSARSERQVSRTMPVSSPVWAKELQTQLDCDPVKLIPDARGLFVLSGTVDTMASSYRLPIVAHLDEWGRADWQFQIKSPDWKTFGSYNFDLLATEDGGCLISTKSWWKIGIVRLDAKGKCLWSNGYSFGYGFGEESERIPRLGSGGECFVLHGESDLMRLDGRGGVIWCRSFADGGDRFTLYDILPSANDAAILVCKSSLTHSCYHHCDEIVLIEVDRDGTIIRTRGYRPATGDDLYLKIRLIESEDGLFILGAFGIMDPFGMAFSLSKDWNFRWGWTSGGEHVFHVHDAPVPRS